MDLLIEKGYNPEFGARPLRRAIERYLEDPLSEEILSGKFTEGIITVDAAEDELLFKREPKPKPEAETAEIEPTPRRRSRDASRREVSALSMGHAFLGEVCHGRLARPCHEVHRGLHGWTSQPWHTFPAVTTRPPCCNLQPDAIRFCPFRIGESNEAQRAASGSHGGGLASAPWRRAPSLPLPAQSLPASHTGRSLTRGETDDPLTDKVTYKGAVYYVDADGGERRQRRALPKTAWKTLDQVRTKTAVGYWDTVAANKNTVPPNHEPWTAAPSESAFLFKRGCVFDGTISVHAARYEGTKSVYSDKVTFGAYGERSKPRPVIQALKETSQGTVVWTNGHTIYLQESPHNQQPGLRRAPSQQYKRKCG